MLCCVGGVEQFGLIVTLPINGCAFVVLHCQHISVSLWVDFQIKSHVLRDGEVSDGGITNARCAKVDEQHLSLADGLQEECNTNVASQL